MDFWKADFKLFILENNQLILSLTGPFFLEGLLLKKFLHYVRKIQKNKLFDGKHLCFEIFFRWFIKKPFFTSNLQLLCAIQNLRATK
jgi:hypothetical protein